MSAQGIATAFVVAAAVAYLVYKVFVASRPPKKRREGPDVPLERLTRRKKRPGCH
jgi:hypothetical protein